MSQAQLASTNVAFTPLYGSSGVCAEVRKGYGTGEALCYLLEIDGACILLDCGWDERFDPQLLEPLRDVAPRVQLVLLSHGDIPHAGALPYAFAKLGLRAPVYGTLPVQRMGRLYLREAVRALSAASDFELFTLADVDVAFGENFSPLRFLQQLVSVGLFGSGVVVRGGVDWIGLLRA